MSGVKRQNDYTELKQAVTPNTSSGTIVGTKISAAGFRRARFIFSFGVPLSGASILSGVGIWQSNAAGSSSGTFVLITSAQFVTSFTTASASNQIAIIDVAVDSAKPWLVVSNYAASGSNMPNDVICELYNANFPAPGTNAARIVTV